MARSQQLAICPAIDYLANAEGIEKPAALHIGKKQW